MNHSSAPWRIRKPSDYAPDSVYEIETDRPNEYHGQIIAAITKGSSNSNANAKLIATAPELLKMVAALVGLLDDGSSNHFAIKAVKEGKALWEKATGESWE
jgi:hypothetical protein